jgi:hypothetical protein
LIEVHHVSCISKIEKYKDEVWYSQD